MIQGAALKAATGLLLVAGIGGGDVLLLNKSNPTNLGEKLAKNWCVMRASGKKEAIK